ncbi:MAG: hypothetical protein LBC03_03865 [Nitrososphaerota archaeon]|jgi:hypothetical protein|nr:hypothetical protein [Nitrososphaerota archaeon]
MSKKQQQLRLVTATGTTLPVDKKLEQRIAALPKTATIADVFQEIIRWENDDVIKVQEPLEY